MLWPHWSPRVHRISVLCTPRRCETARLTGEHAEFGAALDAAALGAVENLWLHYSDGKFGYTVQKDVWRRQKGVFDRFCDKIGWTTKDEVTGQARKRRWFGQSEFFYTLQEAPKGHLPLTSALRGTQLLKALLQHPLWETDDWKRDL